MLTVPANFPLNRKIRRLAARGKLCVIHNGATNTLGGSAHGATHQHEDIIYDAAVLRMAACFEWLIQEQLGDRKTGFNKDDINRFCCEFHAPGHIRFKMQETVKARRNIAHKRTLDHRIDFKEFSQIRRDCLAIDKWAEEKLKFETGVRDVMVSHSLPYLMGNAGDVIKHGALAELVAWRFANCHDKPLRYADPFGGRPWGAPLSAKIPERIKKISPECALRAAQPNPALRIYGSAHVVLNVAAAAEGKAHVFASDSDKLARSDLEASGLRLLSESGGYKHKDGYSILKAADKFNLILIDPFSNFLRDEFWKRDGKYFPEMLRVVQSHNELWLAVFTLNMNPRNKVGTAYDKFKRASQALCRRLALPQN